MKTNQARVGAFEAKNKFSELLLKVGRGTEVTITKHDRPVAVLVPVSAPAAAERKRVTAELRALRKHYSLKGLVVRNLIEEGRR
jgi:prevent-host-death family protein